MFSFHFIAFYLTEISKKLVLTLSDDNEDLNKVVRKYYEKWKKAGPSQGRGLTGVSMDYFLRISYLTQSLQENLRKYLLEEAYHTITKYQKSYSPKQDIKFLHILFNNKRKLLDDLKLA